MHDAVTYANQTLAGQTRAQMSDEVVQRAGVAELDPLAPGLFRVDFAVCIVCDKTRCGVEALDLPMLRQLEPIGAQREERELDARRAGIEHDDGVRHESYA